LKQAIHSFSKPLQVGAGKECALFMLRKNSNLQHDLLAVKQLLHLEMAEFMSKNFSKLLSTLRYKFSQIRMVVASTWVSVNAVFNDVIRKSSKRLHALL
jgi:hypothetical protein